jgi:hypothetical protein
MDTILLYNVILGLCLIILAGFFWGLDAMFRVGTFIFLVSASWWLIALAVMVGVQAAS